MEYKITEKEASQIFECSTRTVNRNFNVERGEDGDRYVQISDVANNEKYNPKIDYLNIELASLKQSGKTLFARMLEEVDEDVLKELDGNAELGEGDTKILTIRSYNDFGDKFKIKRVNLNKTAIEKAINTEIHNRRKQEINKLIEEDEQSYDMYELLELNSKRSVMICELKNKETDKTKNISLYKKKIKNFDELFQIKIDSYINNYGEALDKEKISKIKTKDFKEIETTCKLIKFIEKDHKYVQKISYKIEKTKNHIINLYDKTNLNELGLKREVLFNSIQNEDDLNNIFKNAEKILLNFLAESIKSEIDYSKLNSVTIANLIGEIEISVLKRKFMKDNLNVKVLKVKEGMGYKDAENELIRDTGTVEYLKSFESLNGLEEFIALNINRKEELPDVVLLMSEPTNFNASMIKGILSVINRLGCNLDFAIVDKKYGKKQEHDEKYNEKFRLKFKEGRKTLELMKYIPKDSERFAIENPIMKTSLSLNLGNIIPYCNSLDKTTWNYYLECISKMINKLCLNKYVSEIVKDSAKEKIKKAMHTSQYIELFEQLHLKKVIQEIAAGFCNGHNLYNVNKKNPKADTFKEHILSIVGLTSRYDTNWDYDYLGEYYTEAGANIIAKMIKDLNQEYEIENTSNGMLNFLEMIIILKNIYKNISDMPSYKHYYAWEGINNTKRIPNKHFINGVNSAKLKANSTKTPKSELVIELSELILYTAINDTLQEYFICKL